METSAAAATAGSTHAQTVKAIYEAFGRGDVPAILETLADDVAWEQWDDWFAQREDVPWLQPRTGRDGAAEFFGIVGQFEISDFRVLDVMASENQVAAEIEIDAKVPGGGRLREQELHLWTFDSDGKVKRFRHYADTAKHIAAARGEDTTTGRRRG